MRVRLRTSLGLGLAFCGILLVGCDSDDTSEPGLVHGRYVAEVDITQNATGAGDARSSDRARSEGFCCFTVALDLTSTPDGAISGVGTITYMDENGNEVGQPDALVVTGTREGNAVAMGIALEERTAQYEFEGTASEDGGTLTGSFEGLVGVGVVFERVPDPN